jgi:hypothetical protein
MKIPVSQKSQPVCLVPIAVGVDMLAAQLLLMRL